MKKSLAVVAVAALLSGIFAGPAQAKDVKLTGGGASFTNPLLDVELKLWLFLKLVLLTTHHLLQLPEWQKQ